MSVRILVGDALAMLRTLPSESVQCVVTSPPYWALRAYGTEPVAWGGDPAHEHERVSTGHKIAQPTLSANSTLRGGAGAHREPKQFAANATCSCGAWLGELGQEPTPEMFVGHLVLIFREVRRVLRSDGTLWLNIGDSYAGSGKGPSNSLQCPASCLNDGQLRNGAAPVVWIPVPEGTKPKDLVGIPWMLAFALRADGWYLRSNIRWCKRAPMPESVKDRPTSAVEDIFLLARSERYFYDHEAVRQPNTEATVARHSGPAERRWTEHRLIATIPPGHATENNPAQHHSGTINRNGGGANGANLRNFWELGPEPFPGAHFATFPPEIPRRCIAAGSRKGDTVLDPFGGAGTVGMVADRMGRDAVLIELNPEYAALAQTRIDDDAGTLFADPVAVEVPAQPDLFGVLT